MKAQFEPLVAPHGETFICSHIREKRFRHPLHYHPQIELTYIESGSGTRLVGDHVGTFGPGDLCLLGSNLPHCYHQQEAAEQVSKARVLQFQRNPGGIWDQCGEFVDIARLFDRAALGLRLSATTAAKVAPLITAISTEKRLEKWRLFLELAQHLLADPEPASLASPGYQLIDGHAPSERIHKACQYLLDHYSEALPQAEVARYVHMAPASFSRLFRKLTQKSFTEFLTEVRLGAVCRLLRETECGVTEAAYASGFSSLAHFNRQFRIRYHCTPTQYRNF
jgi:AraC-like DNA-binding protein